MYFVILAFLGIASFLVWYMLKHDHGRKLPVETLWYACGFGALAMIIAMICEGVILPKDFIQVSEKYPLLEQLLLFLVIGAVEEAAKFVPLALFIHKKNYFREYTDGSIYFAICGLTFGLGENILYTITFGTGVGVTRLVLTPFLHAATTSILGFYLINQKLRPGKRGQFILACILIPVLHGLYDFGLGVGIPQFQVLSLMITLLLTLGLFLYFMEANTLDKAASAQRQIGFALAPVPTVDDEPDNFCPSCGKANAHHVAYCASCGRKL